MFKGGKWQKPARKHTCPRKPLSHSVQQMSDHNRFPVLSRLTRARQATLSSMRDLRSASVGTLQLQNVNTGIPQSRRKNRKSRRNRRTRRRQMPYETRQNVCSDPPVVQVYMVTTNPEPSAQDEQPAEQRAEMPSQEGANATLGVPPNPGMLTRARIQALPNPPPFESLPQKKKKAASIHASTSYTPVDLLQTQVASAYMAGGNTSQPQPITMEDIMSKLVEMTAQMNRMLMELDQVKASRTPAPPLPEGEGEQTPPPPPPVNPCLPGPSQPFIMHPAPPLSHVGSLCPEASPPSL